MERAALLSPTDIHTIRRYVNTKYAPLPNGRRAEIVADAIRRALQQRLPNVPEPMKDRMVDRLIARCVVGERRNVTPDDVLDLVAELDVDEPMPREQLLGPIVKWANERSPGRWSPEQIASRLNRRMAGVPLHAEESSAAVERSVVAEEVRDAGKPFFRALAKPAPLLALALAIALGAGGALLAPNAGNPAAEDVPAVPSSPAAPTTSQGLPDVGMPASLKFAEFDEAAVKAYMASRDSLLVEEPYFGAIVDAARTYDIHPLLLFAITGQEQGFVPRSSKDAHIIANNPFNVGHSWMDYNTDIEDSVGIASRLLVRLAESRPNGHDPFVWFNRTYAEDPLWSEGVRKLFHKLTTLNEN
ncbi:hypothetical protein ACF3MZ_08065 [Paenibacillaceae bacterium WGS1546]|uniref:hypothetical protein n=1 Tax=Cohnella sp. WGS1546 TaxID=3366810 RepID=UPI00372D7418